MSWTSGISHNLTPGGLPGPGRWPVRRLIAGLMAHPPPPERGLRPSEGTSGSPASPPLWRALTGAPHGGG
ncbi:hypothetical protein GCM10010195_70990 [Kitasatospora griseola]|nr:hypothetical protein GCM10010195_70990 [Kitasatospora griseola]